MTDQGPSKNECDCPLTDGVHEARGCKLTDPDWDHGCDNCEQRPIVPATGLCGPCTFGEAATAGGNW